MPSTAFTMPCNLPSAWSTPLNMRAPPGHVLLETITLETRGLRTLLTVHTLFQSLADRDRMLQAGMEAGAVESMERLNALLCIA